MPRELVHWEILGEAVRRLSAASTLGKLLTQHRAMAALGALTPDVPYYYRCGGTAFEHCAEEMHGTDAQDTFDPVRAIAQGILEGGAAMRLPTWSFLCGYISHCVVDALFHPLVYYFTGNYYHRDNLLRLQARTYHRAFEAYLDTFWQEHYARETEIPRISRLLREARDGTNQACLLLTGVFSDSLPSQWRAGFGYYASLQRLFYGRMSAFFVRRLARRWPRRFAPIAALFSCESRSAVEFFSSELLFQNPALGTEQRTSMAQLREAAVSECIKKWSLLVPLIEGEKSSVSDVLGSAQGLSLNAGLYRVKRERMQYFSAEIPGFLLEGVRVR